MKSFPDAATAADAILHAIDLAMVQDYDRAKALLEPLDSAIAGRIFLLICQLEQQHQARSRGLSVARHEIGNALAIAQANIEGIVDGILEPTEERLNGILASLSSAGVMLDDLKRPPQVARSETVRLEPFNICVLIAAHASAIAGLAEAKNVKVVYDPCGEKHDVCVEYQGDPSALGQVLRNVLINAVRYTPPGGVVTIRCDRPGNEITLEVHDSGPGIATEDLPHIFETGFRGRNVTSSGSGLGLAVVRRLLAALGGQARVESTDGAGASFVITLPTSH
jgi:signal transduction histidine kinase